MRRWLARVVLAAVILAAGTSLVRAAADARHEWRFLWRHRTEDLAQVQDRMFGSAYMRSIREIRAQVPLSDSIYLVDAQSRELGVSYFVLHDLAPRRVVYLGTYRDASRHRLQQLLPRSARWVAVVEDAPAPPTLYRASTFRALRHRPVGRHRHAHALRPRRS